MTQVKIAQKALTRLSEDERTKNPLADCLKNLIELCLTMESDVAFLEALRAAGVDNWTGYEMAWEIFEES